MAALAAQESHQSAERLQRLLLRRIERQRCATTDLPSLDDSSKQVVSEELAAAIARHEPARNTVERLARFTPAPAAPVSKSALVPPSKASVAAAQKQRASAATPNPPASSPSVSATPVPRATPEPYRHLNIAPTPLLPVPIEGKQEDLWAIMAKQAAADEKRSRVSEKLERARKIEEQHKILDEQVSLRRSNRSVRVVTLRQEQEQIEQNAKLWEAEKQAEKNRLREAHLKLQADCEEQARLVQQRRLDEKRARDEMEAKILERIRGELESAAKQQEAIKEREKRFKEELIAANEAQKKIKAREKEIEAEHDARAIEAQEAQLNKQEAARTAAWEQVKAKMAGREVMMMKLAKKWDELQAIDEQRMVVAQERLAQQQREKEEAAAAKKKEIAIRYFNLQVEQVEARAAAQRREEEESRRREKEAIEATMQKDRESLEHDKAVRREKLLLSRRTLEPQIILQQKKQPVLMSEEEIRLNRQLLERSPELSQRRQPESQHA